MHMFVTHGYMIIPCDHDRSAWELTVVTTLTTFCHARGHMTIRPGARRLGAGAPLTVLRFAPLARLHPVLGFYALNCV
jgi:hypothetical protein